MLNYAERKHFPSGRCMFLKREIFRFWCFVEHYQWFKYGTM